MSLFIFSIASADYSQEIATDAPIAWWRFNEYRYKEGLRAIDEMGNVNSGIYEGDAMTVEAGIDGKSAWFNGNLAGVDIGNDIGPMLDGSTATTFEAWIKNSFLDVGEPVQRIFSTRIDGAKAGIDINLKAYPEGGGHVVVGLRSISSESFLTVKAGFTTFNQWTHLVCVINYLNDRVDVYLDSNLAHRETVNFASNIYNYGEPTQSDQIGRTPNFDFPYRGWLDEVAIYDKALTSSQISAHYANGNPAEPAELWVSEVSSVSSPTLFLGSPSIHKNDNGIIMATYEYWGSGQPIPGGSSKSVISFDGGESWIAQGVCVGVDMASLFEHKGAFYLMGQSSGNITISKSVDYGLTWTTPTNSTDGLLFEADLYPDIVYATGPVPVLFANGRIYRVYELRDKSLPGWAGDFAPLMISADINDDLLNTSSWTMTNSVLFNSSWADPAWGCTDPGWLEGNAVQAPDGNVVAVMRFNSDPSVGIGAILKLNQDNTTLSFDPATGFIDFPGGRNKFHILRDPVTNKYLSLVNNNTDASRPSQRNTLSIIESDDLITWNHVRTIVQDNLPMSWHDSMLNTGFQYVVWEFDGKNIIFVSRTSYDGAVNYHDSNRITFHQIDNYLNFVVPCGSWGYLDSDLNRDCFVDFFDLKLFAEHWISVFDMVDFSDLSKHWRECTQPYGSGCINN